MLRSFTCFVGQQAHIASPKGTFNEKVKLVKIQIHSDLEWCINQQVRFIRNMIDRLSYSYSVICIFQQVYLMNKPYVATPRRKENKTLKISHQFHCSTVQDKQQTKNSATDRNNELWESNFQDSSVLIFNSWTLASLPIKSKKTHLLPRLMSISFLKFSVCFLTFAM